MTVPASDSMSLCASRHRFCADCCWRCCKSAVGDGLVPACPLDKEHSCGSVAKSTAVDALSRWLSQRGQTQARKAELHAESSTWAIRGSSVCGFTSGKLEEVYAASERAAKGAVQCPGRKCKGTWYVPAVPHSTEPQRVVCTVEKCQMSFCAACRHPYHFRSTCAEALRIHARWVQFLQEDLAPFLVTAVQVDPARYERVLKEHTKCKGALDEATREALQRFDELKRMELWKEKNCRHCPHCMRIVNRLSGCDHMVCGNNADRGRDGSNKQRGCGKSFKWPDAPRYQADLRTAGVDPRASGEGEDAAAQQRRFRRDAAEVHLLIAHPPTPVVCDGCGEDIVGPRWQCVQCEGCVDLCVGCVARASRGRPFELRDGRRHPHGHTFRRVRQKTAPRGSKAPVDLVDEGGGAASGYGSVGPSSTRRKVPRPASDSSDDEVVFAGESYRSRGKRRQSGAAEPGRVVNLDESESDDGHARQSPGRVAWPRTLSGGLRLASPSGTATGPQARPRGAGGSVGGNGAGTADPSAGAQAIDLC